MIWFRLSIYAFVLPVFVVAPFGLRRPDAVFLTLIGATFLALALVVAPNSSSS